MEGRFCKGNLYRIKPRHSQPCSAEDGRIQENEEDGGSANMLFMATGRMLRRICKPAGTEQCDRLAGGTPPEGPTTAYAV